MGEGEENTNPGKGEAHRTWKLGPGSSIPSRDQRTLSCHCSFGVLDEVVPFILLSQACYLRPILSVPKPGLNWMQEGLFQKGNEWDCLVSRFPRGGSSSVSASPSAPKEATSQPLIGH